MEKRYADPDEVLYHVGFSANDIKGAKIAILPGDPGRVEGLAKSISDKVEYVATHREYTSWLAWFEGAPILVCSTGMGGPSVGIGIEELARLGITHCIRVGTTGAIQESINLGEVIINNAAVRLDGTSKHYAPLEYPAVASFEITSALVQGAKENAVPYHLGISASSDTFWPGQECYDSFTGYVPRHFQGSLKEWQALGVLNYEMETSALFVICKIFGLEAGSICAAVAKRTESEAVAKGDYYAKGMERIGVVMRRALQILLSESR